MARPSKWTCSLSWLDEFLFFDLLEYMLVYVFLPLSLPSIWTQPNGEECEICNPGFRNNRRCAKRWQTKMQRKCPKKICNRSCSEKSTNKTDRADIGIREKRAPGVTDIHETDDTLRSVSEIYESSSN